MVEALVWSVVTVLAWGTWLAPAQAAQSQDPFARTAYVTLGNLALAAIVAAMHGGAVTIAFWWWMAIAGGVLWTASGWCAFVATRNLGIARAMAVWAPLNIATSIAWGVAVFSEFRHDSIARLITSAAGVVLVTAGILLIVRSSGDRADVRRRRAVKAGLAGAVAAGVLWGSYFLPIRLSMVSMWAGALPLSVGMFVTALAAACVVRRGLPVSSGRDAALWLLSGCMWGIGNFGSLRMMELLGTGRGFTIAQACIVVNALVGVTVFGNPPLRSRLARWVFAGVALATAGAILLGRGNG